MQYIAVRRFRSQRSVRSRSPLPPLGEQRRIAAILDHADNLRAKHRQILTQLDALPQAAFRKALTATHINFVPLGTVARLFGGGSLPSGEPYTGQQGGTLLMKVSDMNLDGNSREINATVTWTDSNTQRSTTVDTNSIMLPKRGASISTNKKRLTTRRTALDPNLMGVAPDSAILSPAFLYEWFNSFDLSTITTGSTVPQLNKKDLTPLLVPLISLEHQRQFNAVATKISEQRTLAAHAYKKAESLLASLQSGAFRGEL